MAIWESCQGTKWVFLAGDSCWSLLWPLSLDYFLSVYRVGRGVIRGGPGRALPPWNHGQFFPQCGIKNLPGRKFYETNFPPPLLSLNCSFPDIFFQ